MQKLSMDELNRKSVSEFREAEKIPVVVILDDVRSMHNVGSVFRTADAFLIESIHLCGFTPRPPHRDIHKTALGATETVAWQYHTSVGEAVQLVKSSGYKVFAVEQVKESLPLQQFDWNHYHQVALIFGNELTGVSPAALDGCDGCIEIPQNGMKHSLNISVAAGIVLWEMASKWQSLKKN